MHAPRQYRRLAAVLAALVLTSRADAEVVLQPLGDGCYLIDFEGIEDRELVGTIDGPPSTTTFGASWRATIDQDAGGTAPVANEPSPSTVAMTLSSGDVNIHGWTDVGSVLPQSVQFRYSAGGIEANTTIQAWRQGGVLLDEHPVVVGSSNAGASCSGDPSGHLCAWETVTFAADGNAITNIYFSGWMAQFALDDLVFCVDPEQAVPCCLPTGECALLSPVACAYAEGSVRPGDACTEITCGAVPAATATWGTIKHVFRP